VGHVALVLWVGRFAAVLGDDRRRPGTGSDRPDRIAGQRRW